MERFLSALSPSLREEVERAVEEHGRGRLEFVANRYIDNEGRWPTDPSTATMLARQFLTQTEDWAAAHYSSSGLASGTVAALAGAGLALGQAKGAIVLSTKGMQNYWKDIVQYSTGLNPLISSAIFRVYDQVTKETPWNELARAMTRDPGMFDELIGLNYVSKIQQNLAGLLTRSAWRGARSALNHVQDMTIGDFSQENPWVESYIRSFAENQRALTERTVRQIVNDALERGVSHPTIEQNLRRLWNLSPNHAAAIENHRKGLARQEKTVGQIQRLTNAYADRLLRSRVKTLTETESLAAFNLGRETLWIRAVNDGQMPPDTVKMWVTAQDDLVCPICQPQDGATAALGSTFDDVGIIVPPAHPNCRCLIMPVEGGIADFSSKKLVFPAQELSKHLGGPRGEDDHPSGTSQDVHSGGTKEEQTDPGFSPKWTNSDIADEWVRFTTPELRRGETDIHRAFLNDIRTAEKIPELYRGINFSLQETDFSNKELKKSLKKWTTEGKTFNLPLSSFTTNITDGFGYAMRGVDPGIMFVVENARGIRVNAKKSAEYKDDKFVDAVNARNEHVTRGKFKVKAVTEGPRGVTVVKIEQIDVPEIKKPIKGKLSKKMDLEETLARTLGTPLSSQEKISKHLIGRHDQKSHGRKGHKREEHTTQDRAKWAVAGYLGSYAVAVGGMLLIPNASKIKNAFTFSNLKNIPQVPKNLYERYQTAQSIKALPGADKYKAIASYMNDGGKLSNALQSQVQEARYISDTIRSWTSGSQSFYRQQLVMGKSDPAMDALAMAISSSTQRNAPLYRGFDASGDVLKAMTTPGNTFKLGPSGFSSQRSVAEVFAKNKYGFGGGNTPIVFELSPGARALRIERHANPSYKWEREWISSGTFRVDNVTHSGGIAHVRISQTELMIPNAMKLPTTQQMLRAQQEVITKVSPATGLVSKPETYQKVYGDRWWRNFDISDDLIEQSGVLSHGWISEGTVGSGTLESVLALTKRLFALEKA